MCVYYIFICCIYIFIHSSVDSHLGCFHVFAVVSSATINIGMQLLHVFLKIKKVKYVKIQYITPHIVNVNKYHCPISLFKVIICQFI